MDSPAGGCIMQRGHKLSCSDKQKRQAGHIEEGYEKRGVPEDEQNGASGRLKRLKIKSPVAEKIGVRQGFQEEVMLSRWRLRFDR
jgi:hypothetical protein